MNIKKIIAYGLIASLVDCQLFTQTSSYNNMNAYNTNGYSGQPSTHGGSIGTTSSGSGYYNGQSSNSIGIGSAVSGLVGTVGSTVSNVGNVVSGIGGSFGNVVNQATNVGYPYGQAQVASGIGANVGIGAGTIVSGSSIYANNQAQIATGLGANVGVGLGVGIASSGSNYPYYPSQTGSNIGATVIPDVTGTVGNVVNNLVPTVTGAVGAVASNVVPAVTGTVGTVLGGVVPIVSQVGSGAVNGGSQGCEPCSGNSQYQGHSSNPYSSQSSQGILQAANNVGSGSNLSYNYWYR